MLIVACIKQVPDTTQVKVDPVTGTLIREGVPFIMNPYDTHALEESLKLKDKFGFRVAVISMGPANAEVTLRKALAVGADRAILLSDRAFGGADTLATSMAIAQAIMKLAREEEVALVICGKQTIDGDTAQVGPGIATRLGYEQLTLVTSIDNLDHQSQEDNNKAEAGKKACSSRVFFTCSDHGCQGNKPATVPHSTFAIDCSGCFDRIMG